MEDFSYRPGCGSGTSYQQGLQVFICHNPRLKDTLGIVDTARKPFQLQEQLLGCC